MYLFDRERIAKAAAEAGIDEEDGSAHHADGGRSEAR
jgi:hypothetical protein